MFKMFLITFYIVLPIDFGWYNTGVVKLAFKRCNEKLTLSFQDHSCMNVIMKLIILCSLPKKLSISLFFLQQVSVQVNLCQKQIFLHQLTHNMTTDCSLNYEFSQGLIPSQKFVLLVSWLRKYLVDQQKRVIMNSGLKHI